MALIVTLSAIFRWILWFEIFSFVFKYLFTTFIVKKKSVFLLDRIVKTCIHMEWMIDVSGPSAAVHDSLLNSRWASNACQEAKAVLLPCCYPAATLVRVLHRFPFIVNRPTRSTPVLLPLKNVKDEKKESRKKVPQFPII